MKCRIESCPYHGRVEVPYAGTKTAKVMIVGEAPGTQEERQGKPFVGRSGDLLGRLLKVSGIGSETVFIANACRCMIRKDEDTASEIATALKNCRGYLDQAITALKPKLIIALGNYALKQLIGKQAILNNRGRFFESEWGIPVFATVHPAYVLRGAQVKYPEIPESQMSMKEKIIFVDFKEVGDFIRSGFKEKKTIDRKKYVLGTDKDLASLAKASVLAVDFETTGVNARLDDVKVLSVSFTEKAGESKVFIAERGKFPKGVTQLIADPNISKLVAARPFEEQMSWHKLKTRMKGKVHDVLALAYLLNENGYSYNLQSVANLYTPLKNIKELAEGMRENLAEAEQRVLIQYNGVDTDATYRAFFAMIHDLKRDPALTRYYSKFLLPVMDSFSATEDNGCLVDMKALVRAEKEIDRKSVDIIKGLRRAIPPTLVKKYGEDFSLTQPDLIRDFLFLSRCQGALRLKANPEYYTPKTNKPQVSEDHLKMFKGVPFIDRYLELMKLLKIKSSFVTKLREYIEPTGRVYPKAFFTRQVTGRVTIKDPAIQTVPQRSENADYVKACYVADKGWLWGARDLSQSEIRIIGWLANDPKILTALRQGIDIHTLTASLVMGVPLNKVTPEHRRKAKAVNFGLIYGMGAAGLKRYAKDEYDVDFTDEESEEFRASYFRNYSKLPVYHEQQKSFVRAHGYVRSPLGRVRHLPDAQQNSNWSDRTRAERQAINMPTQSFSSDLGLIGRMLFLHAVMADRTLRDKVRVMWFVHDSVMFQAKKEVMKKAMALLKECMEQRSVLYIEENFGVKVGYPIESEGKVGKTWATMKKVK